MLGTPYTAYARRLGASPLMLGLLSSAVLMGVLGQVISAFLIERTGKRKTIFLAADLVQRPLWVLVGALPFLIPPQHAQWRLVGLLGLTLLSSFLGQIGSPAWVSWMAYVIPGRIRARFLGARYQVATITGMITALVVGKVLDWDSSYRTFFVIFGLAAFMGTVDIVMFFFIPRRHEWPAADPLSPLGILTTPWRDQRFRRYLYYTGMSAATYGVMGQFGTLYLLENISLGKFLTNLYMYVIPLSIAAVLGPTAGRQISRFGNRPVLLVVTLLAVPLPLMWGLCTHNSHLLLLTTAAIAGVVTAAQAVAELNMLFALTPATQRSAYVASVSLTAGLVGAGAPVVGGIIAQSLVGWHLPLAGITLVNLHVVFLVATVLRVAHVALFIPRLPEPDARPASELVADVLRGPAGAAGAAMRRLRGR